ncbi:patatin-like phospholipase family protein [Maliponia aquimaris]|uniref:NTE family protein RssA n=1 Tax=Maliponia aquimaris TaxID=1673631 RepID=A0A238K0S3_9RHOB|nr:patatin-like phospholipase family protein [Maliponia aquimaris]SMX35974.1 NTE family protein RssA [Maliponia aquimaris]
MTATLGIALGSGGARGWCHIGVLRSLAAQGAVPDCVAGCSMGALVGAAWAAGKLDGLETWARGLTQARLLHYLDPRMDRGGLIAGAAVTRVLQELGLPERIEDLPKPLLVVATDMATGREVWLREGPLIPAVRASISIPGVFAPQRLDGRWLLDGGLINPVPTSAVRALGARRTIAVNPNAKHGRKLWEGQPPQDVWQRFGVEDWRAGLPEPLRAMLPEGRREAVPAYMEVVSVSIDILTEFLRKAREAVDPADVMLEADLLELSVMELFRAAEAIDEGARIAQAAAGRIAALITA